MCRRPVWQYFDLASGVERQPSIPAARIGMPAWSPEGDLLIMVAETRPPIFSFTRILEYSLSRNRSSFVATPRDLGVQEVRWSRDGRTLVAKLSDRFVDSLWRLH